MASLRVLAFDHEGRPIQFDTWLDDLQLYLLSDSRDSVSLFDHTSGAAPAPPATADSATRSQTAQALYNTVVAHYSLPTTAAVGRLLLPYPFPELPAFATVEDLVSHLRTSDARYRAALPAEFLERNLSPMDHFLALDPTVFTVDLLEQHLLAADTSVVAVGAARGTPRTPFFEGCSPSPLSPSYASAAAVDVLGAEDVRAASASGKRRSSKGKGGKGGGGGSEGGGGGSSGASTSLSASLPPFPHCQPSLSLSQPSPLLSANLPPSLCHPPPFVLPVFPHRFAILPPSLCQPFLHPLSAILSPLFYQPSPNSLSTLSPIPCQQTPRQPLPTITPLPANLPLLSPNLFPYSSPTLPPFEPTFCQHSSPVCQPSLSLYHLPTLYFPTVPNLSTMLTPSLCHPFPFSLSSFHPHFPTIPPSFCQPSLPFPANPEVNLYQPLRPSLQTFLSSLPTFPPFFLNSLHSSPLSANTPPLSANTPPLSANTPPLSANTPPLSVNTPPLSANTPPLSAITPPLSANTPPLSANIPFFSDNIAPLSAPPSHRQPSPL
ncbi:unnamed protein product [Closterium sp. NIES-53]